MSVIVKSKEDITKSPLNVSSSKAMYSFSKADRFDKHKDGSTSSTYFYNLPEVRMQRAASIGKGFKYDFTRDSKGKNTAFYNLGSDFDQSHPYSPKFTFGIGREHYGKVYYDTNKMFDKNVPGPGKYNYLKDFGSDASKFSIKGKPDDKGLSKSQSKTPGPGAYPITLQINKEGKYPISKFKNCTKIIFGANKGLRFNYSYNNFPGPQKYEIKPLINGEGKIFISKFKSSPGKTIVSRHEMPVTKKVPGPGAYGYFSEWGVYESKNAHESGSGSREEHTEHKESTKRGM